MVPIPHVSIPFHFTVEVFELGWFPYLMFPFHSIVQLSGLEEALEYCELEKQFANQQPKDG